MKYNFDEIIDRSGTCSMNVEGFRQYVFNDPNFELPFKDEEYIRMWLADMEFATPDVICNAIKERVDRRIFGYTRVYGDRFYRAFSAWTQKMYDWNFDQKDLVFAPGIIRALFELVDYICKPKEKVLIFTPSYGYFKRAADYNGRELVWSDLINDNGYYTIDYDDLARKAADPLVRLCIFCNPHNPTGRVWTPQELEKVADICEENNVLIISDEIHCDLLRTGLHHTPMAKVRPESDNIITCMAPSKTFNLAGLMFSAIIIPNKNIRAIWDLRHYGNENPLSLAAATAGYEQGEDWVNELREYLTENFKFVKSYLAEHLPKAVFRISEATYLAWIDISAYVTPDMHLPLFFAQKAGVLLEGGNLFVSNSDGYIRINIACPRSIVAEGLKRICSALNAL